MRHVGYAVVTVIFLFLAWTSWENEKPEVRAPVATATVIRPATNNNNNYNQSEHVNIDRTLQIVADKLRQKIDVNGDGKSNCIDAAVTFYKYYPDKSKVCIEINVNPDTGMNHLFNCVFTDGVWKAIEPQTYFSGQKNYYMWAVWGNQYNNKYNRDETEKWQIYAR